MGQDSHGQKNSQLGPLKTVPVYVSMIKEITKALKVAIAAVRVDFENFKVTKYRAMNVSNNNIAGLPSSKNRALSILGKSSLTGTFNSPD